MSKDLGTDFKLYTALSSPSTPEDETDTAYDLVGFATELSLDPSREMIESADKDSGQDMEIIPGRRDFEISGTFNLEKTHDQTAEGQEDLWDSLLQDNTAVYFLLTTGITGDQVFYGQGYVTALTVNAPDQDMLTIEVTIRVDGGISRTSAP